MKYFNMLMLLSLLVFSCKKKETLPEEQRLKGRGVTPFFFLTPVDGALVLSSEKRNFIYTYQTIGDSILTSDTTLISIIEGVYAVFPGDTGYLDAGFIIFNDDSLFRYDNNFYELDPYFPDTLGIDFNVPVYSDWNVQGAPSLIGFTHTGTVNLPTDFTIPLDTVIQAGLGYTLTVSAMQNADSIAYVIMDVNDNSNKITKITSSNVLSASFTSGELMALNANRVSVIAAAFNYQTYNKNNQLVSVANQRVVSNDYVVLEP